MAVIELKRPDYTNPVKGVQNAVDDWREGRISVPEGVVMLSVTETGEVEVYAYGSMDSPLKVLGLLYLGQHTMATMAVED